MTISADHAPLSPAIITVLSLIVETARTRSKVVYLKDDQEIHGVARHFSSYPGGLGLNSDMDIRDAYLRITLRGGSETWYPVAELLTAALHKNFVAYDWS